MILDVKKLKKQFPIFNNNPNLVYLDTAASSLKPAGVINSLKHYYEDYGVNIHRGVYNLSYEATEMYESSRSAVANFINAESDEIVFTKGTTSSLNMIARSYLDKLGPEDEIITSELEHHSSFLPWLNVSKKTNAKLKFVKLDENGDFDLEDFKSLLNKNTKVVALTYVSNVLGRVQNIKEIARLAKTVKAITVIDAAQAVGHFQVDVKDLDVDYLAFSAHKMLGPSGVGVLYIKKVHHESLEPFEFGGEMVDYVNKDRAVFRNSPFKYEAGTPIIAGVIAFKEAIRLINEVGYDKIIAHNNYLTNYVLEKLKEIPEVIVYNKSDTGIITFNLKGIHPHDAATIFDSLGIALRAGEHCAQLTLKWLGQTATLRASFYLYNDLADADRFIEAVKYAVSFFRKF